MGRVDSPVFQDKKHIHPKASTSRSEFCSHVTTTALPGYLSRLSILTMNARRFQRTHLLRGVGDYVLNASKDTGMVVADLAPTCESEPVVDAVCAAEVGSDRPGRVLDRGSAREDRSSDLSYVGDTQQSFSAEDDDSILHTHHLYRSTREAHVC